jgi:hypothetical protein
MAYPPALPGLYLPYTRLFKVFSPWFFTRLSTGIIGKKTGIKKPLARAYAHGQRFFGSAL